MSKFSEKLTELRQKRDISQDVLAEYLDKTRASISNYEKGNTEPKYEDLIKIAEYFNVTTDFLLGRVNAEKHYFDKYALETEDEIALRRYLQSTEALLREQGKLDGEKLRTAMRFMEFTFRQDLEEEKEGKKNS